MNSNDDPPETGVLNAGDNSIIEVPIAGVTTEEFGIPIEVISDVQVTSIYWNTDTRQDFYKLDDAVKQSTSCVGAIVNFSSLKPSGKDTFKLNAGILGDSFRLDTSQQFSKQPSFDPNLHIGPFGTSFVVKIKDEEYLITAGHLLWHENGEPRTPAEIADLRVVFGFVMKNEDDNPTLNIHKDRIYNINEVITCKNDSKDDWAICRLDRPVVSEYVTPCKRISLDEVRINNPLYVLGHPSGLPMKQASGIVKESDPSNSFFKTDLDTFTGNSGSPVFNAITNEIVGILIFGVGDYADVTPTTNEAKVIKVWNNKMGEGVTRIAIALKDANLI